MAAPNNPPERVSTVHPAKTANPNTASQENDQDSQKPAPSVVVQVESPITASANTDHHEDSDKQLDFYTLMLAIFTAALVVVGFFQYRMMGQHKEGLDGLLGAIKTQAEIANRSLILQFRPRIVIRGGWVNGTNLADTKQPIGGRVQFVVTNAGGTDAHIYKSGFIVKALGDSITESGLMDGATSIGEFTLTTGQGTTVTIPISLEMVRNIQNEFHRRNEPLSADTKPVHAIGNLWYKDDLGISRSTGIFRKFDPKEMMFVPEENYTSEYSD
jgi:hypothetical protein